MRLTLLYVLRFWAMMFLLALSATFPTFADNGPQPGKEQMNNWINSHFAKGRIPPFSFVYGGKESGSFIKKWKYKVEGKVQNDDLSEYLFTYTEGSTGLEVKCKVTGFHTFQAVEWVLEFTNNASTSSPLIEKLNTVDQRFDYKNADKYTLHYARGSDAKKSDFSAVDSTLLAGNKIYLTPGAGRSSDNGAFSVLQC